jgi:hypothetical protein
MDIIGTWALVHATSRDPDGKELPSPYGPKKMGRVTFNADGRMMAVLVDGRPDLSGARDYASYCGNYRFDGKTLVTRVDAASDPERMGTDQVRDVRFEGERMVLRPPPRAFGDVTHHRELYWEKISST